MRKEDKGRTKRGETLVNMDESISVAQEEELLEFEAEMRAAGQVPDPRQTGQADAPTPPKAPPRLHRPMFERLQHPSMLKDRVGARILDNQ